MKKICSFVLSAVMILLSITAVVFVVPDKAYATQSKTGNFNKTYTLTGNGASDMVAIAKAQNGRSQSSMGYTEAWCADFVSDCAILANQKAAIPQDGNCQNLYTKIKNAGGTPVSSPQKGDIVFYNWDHVGIMVNSTDCISGNMNNSYVQTLAYTAINAGSTIRFLRPKYNNTGTSSEGSTMTSGASRQIPDGDYIIISSKKQLCYLDISSNAYPAANETNVQMYNKPDGGVNTFGDWDIWSLKYSDGFYKIKQKGTSMCLDVIGSGKADGANVHVYKDENSVTHEWCIKRASGQGYTLQAKSSGFYLTADGTANNSNVCQRASNGSASQHWIFIPYKPEQTIADGKYILISSLDDSLELDVAGNTNDVANGTNVQVESDNNSSYNYGAKSRYNAFNVKYQGYGYYNLYHAGSGKTLRVSEGSMTSKANIQIWEDINDSMDEEWAITKDGLNGGYVLKARCSGMALDVADGSTEDGTNVWQYYYNGSASQTWSFIPAEYTITYNANGGQGAPSAQTKYYKSDLILSSIKPTRTGYTFLGWSSSSTAIGASFSAGDTYSIEANMTLYAVWEKNNSQIDPGYTGFWQDDNGIWYYAEDGMISEVTGLFKGTINGTRKWYMVESGKVNFTYTGFGQNVNGWYYVKNGTVSHDTALVKGTVKGKTTWWKVVDGKVQFADGLATNKNGTYYVNNGAVDYTYTGFWQEPDGEWWYVKQGKVPTGNILVKDTYKGTRRWYAIINGKLDLSYTGFAVNENGWYYVTEGKVSNETALIKGTVKGTRTWWKVVKGKVSFTDGVATNKNGTYYVTNGAVDYSFTGTYTDPETGVTYNIIGGKAVSFSLF